MLTPWAMLKRPPRGYASACTAPTPALPNAMPAIRLAVAMSSRACRLDGLAYALGSALAISLMAPMARASVIDEALTDR
ncbi:hypothetical protein D3C76_1559110 [compost metagenome]